MNSQVVPLPRLCNEPSHAGEGHLPAAPRTPAETGLPVQLLGDLVLKVMQQHGITHVQELSAHLKLPVAVLETLFSQLRRDTLVEVRRRGALDGDVIYDLTQAGRIRAADALGRNLYCGPAPVPLAAYTARVQSQSVGSMGVTHERLQQVLADVVVSAEVRDQFGAAMNSQRAIMVYGPAGSGKTYLCEQMARLLSGPVAIPHAIDVDGEIIRFFDPLMHRPVARGAAESSTLDMRHRSDDRWVLCERPIVVTGGELTLEMLDLVFDPRAGYYHAPPHFKANNGIFLVDDLGRQLVTPRQLLNRWVIPMEHRHDYLMLRNGGKFRIPFDTLLFFSSNLRPDEIADEAFLRRIGYKIFVGEVTLDDYRRITRDVCDDFGVPYAEDAFDRLVTGYHRRFGRPLLACTPRDLVSQIADYAAYRGIAAELTPDLLDWAWHNHYASRDGAQCAARQEETS
jgi:predicted ATPase with chaperone activity